jgi:hypothetical protein
VVFIYKEYTKMEKKKDNTELIAQARNSSLADYFITSGYTTERHGHELYIKEIPSLCINLNTNSWFHHYSNTGGTNAINCLTEICRRDFKTAVAELTGTDIRSAYQKPYSPPVPKNADNAKQSELVMPDRASNMSRVFAYMCQTRKIPAEVVSELAKAGLLYQSIGTITGVFKGVEQTFKVSNAVFVHRDESGKTVGGEVQGVITEKRYKGVAQGTADSAFIFQPVPDKEVKRAYLFESAIDLMSFYSLCDKKKLDGAVFVSMAGLKPAYPKMLQAQGVEILSCVDNDTAGRAFEAETGFKRMGNMLETECVKDWNDLLKKRADVGLINEKAKVNDTEKKTIFNFSKKKNN